MLIRSFNLNTSLLTIQNTVIDILLKEDYVTVYFSDILHFILEKTKTKVTLPFYSTSHKSTVFISSFSLYTQGPFTMAYSKETL